MTLEDYLCAITSAETIEHLWDMHCQQMGRYGFDRMIYGFTNFLSDRSFGDPDDFIILSNHDQAYVEHFLNGMYFDSPMLQWSRENEGACSWQYVHDLYERGLLSDASVRVREYNISMDVVAGYTISFSSQVSRSRGAIALTSKPGMSQEDTDAIWAEHGRAITLMNNVLHLKIISLPYDNKNRTLTERQREVLSWVGDGKSIQDIAQIIDIKPVTVEKHLRLARESLGVDTTAQAVLKAWFQKQIYASRR